MQSIILRAGGYCSALGIGAGVLAPAGLLLPLSEAFGVDAPTVGRCAYGEAVWLSKHFAAS